MQSEIKLKEILKKIIEIGRNKKKLKGKDQIQNAPTLRDQCANVKIISK
jgi:hypothetical protein